ncbi:SDR family NAD(P)-dependent oxidoreductase [Lederbergia citrea]|uniref:SDR family NAD(P)-dependent oxidoreductase n=1 Tax=Lederbergia citrea TaxID=2833581 RepID=UPI001BCA2807|nr:glucose 1-dehydrogenase [Lederbergia citrea]MBS4202705.1 glucose 1-dehydrogenase [Lederbergia citrea]
MSKRLEDKVIVITGATKGIGKGIAYICAQEGAKIVVSGRNKTAGQLVVEEVTSKYGTEAIFIQTDISTEAACQELIETSAKHFGRIDGLVNNAGIFPRGTILETSEELFDSIFDVNIKGAFFCSKYAIKEMLKIGGGSIVQIGSTNAYKGMENLVAYSCSKGALLTLNKSIAAHFAKQKIRSNWITVGWVASEGEVELHESMGMNEQKLHEWAESVIPTGKMQTAEDMAYGVVYLLADESNQVTGTELHINGGLEL